MSTREERIVYATGIGRVRYCKRCGQPEDSCRCRAAQSATAGQYPSVPNDGTIRLARDKKGRGGKVVTLVLGLPGDEDAVARLAHELKKYVGSGGTVRGSAIEIQGDHRDRLEARLRALGFQVKRMGG